MLLLGKVFSFLFCYSRTFKLLVRPYIQENALPGQFACSLKFQYLRTIFLKTRIGGLKHRNWLHQPRDTCPTSSSPFFRGSVSRECFSLISPPPFFLFQLLAAFSVSIGCLLNGTVIGYTGPANPSLMDVNGTNIYGNEFSVDLQSISWISKF